jgi:hypothetical protein
MTACCCAMATKEFEELVQRNLLANSGMDYGSMQDFMLHIAQRELDAAARRCEDHVSSTGDHDAVWQQECQASGRGHSSTLMHAFNLQRVGFVLEGLLREGMPPAATANALATIREALHALGEGIPRGLLHSVGDGIDDGPFPAH